MSKRIHDIPPAEVAEFVEMLQGLIAKGLNELFDIKDAPEVLLGFVYPDEPEKGMLMGNMNPEGMARMKQVLETLEEAGGIPALKKISKAEVVDLSEREIH